jgi:hypothetical protein
MWTYAQSTGRLTDPEGVPLANGYSGRGAGLDNPSAQATVDVGPIPAGQWTIGAFFDDPGGKGPMVCHLTACKGTETFGRTGFMIHGDNTQANHSASEGCIVLSRPLREQIAASGDSSLEVIP